MILATWSSAKWCAERHDLTGLACIKGYTGVVPARRARRTSICRRWPASTASVDLALPLDLDELIVLALMVSSTRIPDARAFERLLRNHMSAGLDAEIELPAKSDSRMVRIDATEADLAVMGPNFMDNRRRLSTLEHALRSIRVTVGNAPTAGTLA